MKRIFALILCVCSIFAICGCAQKPIKEYKGTPVVSLTYETVDYMGGYTEVYLFDFEENTVKRRAYLPSELEGENAPVQVIRQFTEEEEKRLIDKLYTYGLFGIKENYRSPAGISDGGGWSLALAFGDGTVKKSKGSNNAPHKVFENCAKAFYDICQTGIVASVPTEYYCPPNLSYTFRSDNASYGYTTYGRRLGYEWNGFSGNEQSAYEVNEGAEFMQSFYSDTEYTLVLYTANYSNLYDYARFSKCTVTLYDYNEGLTNPLIVYSGGWFKQVEMDLQLNKIYVVRLSFKNGDYVAYTFNTKTAESSIA